MSLSTSRRRLLRCALLCIGGAGLPGCGTIFYPERRGQPTGKLDWKVVAFDALGLVLFFIPGVVAFAVDFATGAIYLPPDHYGKTVGNKSPDKKLTTLQVPRGNVDRHHIEQAVSQHVGQEVSLVDGEFETRELETIDQFWATRDALAAEDTATSRVAT